METTPVVTRTDEEKKALLARDANAPGPETNKYLAVYERDLQRGAKLATAKLQYDASLDHAETWKEQHLKLVEPGPDEATERKFVERGYKRQIDEAAVGYGDVVKAIEAEYGADKSNGLLFFTHERHLPDGVKSWEFEAAEGFGDLTLEEQIKIAMAQKP
jgi:hypothetical protein